MSENTTTNKSIYEIMEMIDYSLNKMRRLGDISKSIIILGDISDTHTRKTLAEALSKQVSEADWGARLAQGYIDELEAVLDDKVDTIDNDEEVTENDLPFK